MSEVDYRFSYEPGLDDLVFAGVFQQQERRLTTEVVEAAWDEMQKVLLQADAALHRWSGEVPSSGSDTSAVDEMILIVDPDGSTPSPSERWFLYVTAQSAEIHVPEKTLFLGSVPADIRRLFKTGTICAAILRSLGGSEIRLRRSGWSDDEALYDSPADRYSALVRIAVEVHADCESTLCDVERRYGDAAKRIFNAAGDDRPV